MTRLKLQTEIKPMSICELYDEIAKAAGFDPDCVHSYDCTKVVVSKILSDRVKESYGPDRLQEFAMHWVVYGPKVGADLQDYEVEFEDEFIKTEEEE